MEGSNYNSINESMLIELKLITLAKLQRCIKQSICSQWDIFVLVLQTEFMEK